MKDINEIVDLQKKIVPELVSVIEERYSILKCIRYYQPVGRRVLASQLDMAENSVRNGVRALKEAGLIELSGIGMSITPAGRDMVDGLRAYMDALHGLGYLEQYLKRELGVGEVKIVPGDSERDGHVFLELGNVAAKALSEQLADGMVIAVSGGSTMAAVASSVEGHMPGAMVVPTRGGLGENAERQANHVASVMAGRLGGRYRLLHIPEVLTGEALDALKASDSSIVEIESLMKNADVLIHSIGRADIMAGRRRHAPKIAEKISEFGAGEALGRYFAIDGKCIYTYCANGFRLNDLAGVGRKIAVAGGKAKAEAIIAVVRAVRDDVLVIDESAAGKIQSIIKSEKAQKTF